MLILPDSYSLNVATVGKRPWWYMKSLVPDANPTDCWHNLVIFLTLTLALVLDLDTNGHTPRASLLLYPSLCPEGAESTFQKSSIGHLVKHPALGGGSGVSPAGPETSVTVEGE